MHPHTTRMAVGEVPLRNCTLRRMEPEVVRGAEVAKPPYERQTSCRSHMSVAAPQAFNLSNTSAEMNICGEPIYRRATLM